MKIIWNYGAVPENLKVTQVYGIVFNNDGQMLLKVENKKGRKVYSFAGGTPELFDKDREATLRREFLEEVNTTLKKDVYLVGYQYIDEENGKPAYAQMRYTALIDNIGKVQPDPDNGETYERILATPQEAIDLLGWGEVGKLQIEEAVRIAKEKFNICFKDCALTNV